MILLKHVTGIPKLQIILSRDVPGKRGQPVKIGLDNPVLGGLRRHLLQTRQLTHRLFLRLIGQAGFLDLDAVVLNVLLAVVSLTKLFADGIQLLAQVILTLVPLDLLFRLLLNLLPDLADIQFVGQHADQQLHLLGKMIGLQQLLGLGHLNAHVGGDQVDQQTGVAELLDEADGLIRELWNQLGESRGDVQKVPSQSLFNDRLLDNVGRHLDARSKIGLLRSPFHNTKALQALDEDRQRAII